MKLKHLLFSSLMLLSTGTAWADVTINATNFPDANFRKWLLNQSYGSDGKLTDAEIADVISIDVSYNSILSLQGIEFFTALTWLYCDNNQFTSLDVSKNTALTELYCYSNQLTSLDLSKNTALTWLNCYGNKLTSLDVSGCTKLTRLDCYDNRLNSLSLSNNTALTRLNCSNNRLNSLDLSKNTVLEELRCHSNQFASLNVSGCTALRTLWCYSNQLTSLDVSKNTALKELSCYSNQLISLYVSKNSALTSLWCYGNRIKGAAMDALVSNLPTVNGGGMYVIYNANEVNVMTTTQVATAKAKGWKPYYYDSTWKEYGGSESIVEDIAINETNFPDANFRMYLLTQSYGSDGKITKGEIADLTSIYVSGRNIESLQGIEYFTALKNLSCYNTQLTSLDVSMNTALKTLECYKNLLVSLDLSKNTELTNLNCSENRLSSLDVSGCVALTNLNCSFTQLVSLDLSKNTELKYLECSGNQFTSLDLSKNTKLTLLECYGNKLTSLDLSKNTALEVLDCHGNQLTSLDLSRNTVLIRLYCNKNQLTSLDVSKNTMLIELDCYQNRIKGVAMDAFIASLPTISSGTTMRMIYDVNEGNVMTTIQVWVAKAKGWIPYYKDGVSWKEYSGSEPVVEDIAINSTNFPDANFRSWLRSQSFGADGNLTDDEITEVKSINVSSKDIQSLQGIEYFNELTELDCSGNELTSLDLSKNTKLTELYCYQNQIKGENMDALVASLPTVNQGEMYVMCNENEQNVITSTQIAVAKEKGWSLYYENQYGWLPYSIVLINEKNFPDANFRSWLKSQSYGSDGVLTTEEIAGVTSIDVSSKSIQSLKGIEFFTALTELYCYQNKINGNNMYALIEMLPTVTAGTLDVIFNEDEQNEMNTAQVAVVKAKGWTPRCYDGVKWEEYAGSVPDIAINSTNFPDANFCSWLWSQSYGSDGKLTSAEIAKVTSISVPWVWPRIQSLQGIEYFTELTELDCRGNELTSLDVTKNTKLAKLWCDSNQLTSLDVSGCTALKWLTCYGNKLTSLDVSGCTALTRLDCSGNELTSLDVSGCTALPELSCYGQKLTSLNVSGCTALTRLTCSSNQLTSLDVSGCTALDSLSCSTNLLTSLDVSKNTALKQLYCSSNQLTSLDVSKNTKLIILTCGSNQLTSLDVSKNTALEHLDCYGNRLTSLDVSNNTALTWLWCYDNQLTSLDVSKNTKLTELYCYQNQIKGAAMDALVASLRANYLFYDYTMRVIYYENEQNVMTTTQVAAAKAKGWTPYYTDGSSNINGFLNWKEYAGVDPSTGVNNVEASEAENSAPWYTINGTMLSGRPTEKGIYIHNGKKVVVK